MDISFSRWYTAVRKRRSRRHYDPNRPIESRSLATLEGVCREFTPFPHARAYLLSKPAKDMEELVSNYKAASQKRDLRSVEINCNMLSNFGIKTLVIFQTILVLREKNNLSAIEKTFLRTDPVARKL